jgi:hypothetical protein
MSLCKSYLIKGDLADDSDLVGPGHVEEGQRWPSGSVMAMASDLVREGHVVEDQS